MLPLNRLIRDGLRHYHLEKGVNAAQAVSVWDRVAGPAVAAVTHADIVRDGVLVVFTKSSAWSQELTMLREQLVAGLNRELGVEAVKDIRFQVKRFSARMEEQPAKPGHKALSEADVEVLRALSLRLQGDAAERLRSIATRNRTRSDREGVCPGCGGPLDAGHRLCPYCR